MRMRTTGMRARLAAGAFFLLAGAALPAGAAPRLQLAAERSGKVCPPASPVLGIVRLDASADPPAGASKCLLIVEARDLSDASLDLLTSRLARFQEIGPVLLDLSNAAGEPDRIPFAIKKLSSAVRSVFPGAPVGLDLGNRPAGDEDLSAYVDAVAPRPDAVAPGIEGSIVGRWLIRPGGASPPSEAIRAIAGVPREARPSVALVALTGETSEDVVRALERLQAYFKDDVSPDPTPTTVTEVGAAPAAAAVSHPALRYFD